MTITFGRNPFDNGLREGDKMTIYFQADEFGKFSMGYFKIIDKTNRVLRSVSDYNSSYRALKLDKDGWKCLRGNSVYDVHLNGYALWDLREHEIHGFVTDERTVFGGLSYSKVSLQHGVEDSVKLTLPDGVVDIEEEYGNITVKGDVRGCRIEYYKEFNGDFEWFDRVSKSCKCYVRIASETPLNPHSISEKIQFFEY